MTIVCYECKKIIWNDGGKPLVAHSHCHKCQKKAGEKKEAAHGNGR